MGIKLLYQTLGAHPLIRRAGGTFGVQLGLLVVSTVISILITRAIGAAERGALSWVMTYSALGVNVALAGIPLAAKKYTAQLPHQAGHIGLISSSLILITSALVMAAYFLLGADAPISRSHREVFLLAMVLIPLCAFAALQNNMLLGLDKQRAFHVSMMIEKAGTSLLSAGLLITQLLSALSLVMAAVLANLVRLAYGLRVLPVPARRGITRDEVRSLLKVMRRMMVSSYVASLALLATQSLLVLVLGHTVSAAQLGYFAVAKLLADMLTLIPLTIGSYAPQYMMAQHTTSDYSRARGLLLLLTVGVTALGALPLVLMPEWVIGILFGEDFAPAAQLLPLLALGVVGYSVVLVMQTIISAHRQEHWQLIAPLSVLILMAGYCFWFYPHISAVVAAQLYAVLMLAGGMASLLMLALLGVKDVTRLTPAGE